MALKLDGDPESFFEVPDHPSLDANLGSVFTIEAWVNPAKNLGTDEILNEYLILNKEDVLTSAVRTRIPSRREPFRSPFNPRKPRGDGWTAKRPFPRTPGRTSPRPGMA